MEYRKSCCFKENRIHHSLLIRLPRMIVLLLVRDTVEIRLSFVGAQVLKTLLVISILPFAGETAPLNQAIRFAPNMSAVFAACAPPWKVLGFLLTKVKNWKQKEEQFTLVPLCLPFLHRLCFHYSNLLHPCNRA